MFFNKKKKEGENKQEQQAAQGSASQDAPLGLPPLQEGESEEESDDQNSGEQDNDQQAASNESGGAGVGKVMADVEKIKAQLQALTESRKATTERFTRISEQIGGLRNTLTNHEKTIGKVEAQATKAADLVSSVQPEKLKMDMKRQDTKIEALKSRVESNQLINEQIRKELKEIRNKISMFRGVEEIIKLSDDVKKELRNIQKIKAHTESAADKVENIFGEVEKNFSEFKKYKDMADNLNSQFKDVMKQMDQMQAKFKKFASRDEFEDLKKEVGNKEKKLQDFLSRAEQSKESIDNLNNKLVTIEQDHAELQEMHSVMHENFERLRKWIQYFKNLETKVEGNKLVK